MEPQVRHPRVDGKALTTSRMMVTRTLNLLIGDFESPSITLKYNIIE